MLFMIFLLIIVKDSTAQPNKLNGSIEMYYRGTSTITTNNKELYSSSSFTKLISLYYLFYVMDPNFLTVVPAVRLYDVDVRSSSYQGKAEKDIQEFNGDYKNLDYSIMSGLFPGSGFPLTTYIKRGRKTTDNNLFSTNDMITMSRGFSWSFHMNSRPYFSYLPYFNTRYDLTETFKNSQSKPLAYAETISYSLFKNLFKRVGVGYNYRTLKTHLYEYQYHRANIENFSRINKMTELNIKASYENRDEYKEYNTYRADSFLRFRPNKSLFSFLRHNLLINDNEDTYRQLNQIQLNNRYFSYLTGSPKGKENVIFNGSLSYTYNHTLNSIKGYEAESSYSSHGISSLTSAVYERLIAFFYLKPGYQLGLGYNRDSEEHSSFSHSHKLMIGGDNRGNRDLLVYSSLYYQYGFTYSDISDIITRRFGYNHTISSYYVKNLYIELPLNYQYDTSEDETGFEISQRDNFRTELILRYKIIRFLYVRSKNGYYYSKISGLDFGGFSRSFRAEQGLYYSRSRFNSGVMVAEEKKYRDNNINENIYSVRFNVMYTLRAFTFTTDYTITYNNKVSISLLVMQAVRRI